MSATLDVVQKVALVQADLTEVKKDTEGFNYQYASLNGVITALHLHLTKQKLAVLHSVISIDGKPHLQTKVMDKDGAGYVDSLCPLSGFETTLGGKNNIMQNMGAAITYARRYNLLNIFNLFQEDDDAQSLTVVQSAPKAPVANNPPKNNVSQSVSLGETSTQLEAPNCPQCGTKVMRSIYPNKVTGQLDWYCKPCKKSYPVE